jgi:ABC-type sulfate/molybdate transport systems ATPase subunit
MIEVRALSACAGRRELLSLVSFSLAEGQTLALLGPSGSGKTTLLRLLMGFHAPSSGTIEWKGRLLSAPRRILVSTERRRFGMVFQDAALFPHLTVAENVAFGLQRLEAKERRERTEEWLARLRLEALRRRSVQALSGGERQRVALARALAPQPELLLLDEPFSNLDRLVRFDLLAELKKILREARTTTIVVTHDARDVVDLGSEFLLLASGALVRQGRMDEVLREPKQDWTTRFLACGLGRSDLLEEFE